MNYHGLFRNEGLPQIRVALVGVGDFGATLLDQARNIEKIDTSQQKCYNNKQPVFAHPRNT